MSLQVKWLERFDTLTIPSKLISPQSGTCYQLEQWDGYYTALYGTARACVAYLRCTSVILGGIRLRCLHSLKFTSLRRSACFLFYLCYISLRNYILSVIVFKVRHETRWIKNCKMFLIIKYKNLRDLRKLS